MSYGMQMAFLAFLARFRKDPAGAWLDWGRRDPNPALGLCCLERAAALDSAEAHFELGLFYEGGGLGVGLKSKGIEHYRRAAELGHAEAMHRLGGMLCWGSGIHPDPEAGRDALRNAAEMGWGASAAELADIYGHGEGVPVDVERAAYWHRRAEILGCRPATRSALLVGAGGPDAGRFAEVAGNVSARIRARMDEMSLQAWFPWFFWLVVAPAGVVGILAVLAVAVSFIGFAQFLSASWVTAAFLTLALGVPLLFFLYFWKSQRRGMRWSRRGRSHQARAEGGDPQACFERAQAFLRGSHETPKDLAEARRWLGFAAGAGHVEAMVLLAGLLRFGYGGLKDPARARSWLEGAAERGHAGARQALAEWDGEPEREP